MSRREVVKRGWYQLGEDDFDSAAFAHYSRARTQLYLLLSQSSKSGKRRSPSHHTFVGFDFSPLPKFYSLFIFVAPYASFTPFLSLKKRHFSPKRATVRQLTFLFIVSPHYNGKSPSLRSSSPPLSVPLCVSFLSSHGVRL